MSQPRSAPQRPVIELSKLITIELANMVAVKVTVIAALDMALFHLDNDARLGTASYSSKAANAYLTAVIDSVNL
ncbi:MAG: hypothetical protein NT086_21185 [Proteobacteria bacterium]|nr:hypothetical protein [Pseudomonadota bacterium]